MPEDETERELCKWDEKGGQAYWAGACPVITEPFISLRAVIDFYLLVI